MGYLVSLVIIILALGSGVILSSGTAALPALFSIPSLIIVIVPTVTLTIAVSSWKTFKQSWALPFASKTEATQEEIRDACASLSAFGSLSVLMGIIGTFTGMILMLMDLSDPSRIWLNLAVASLCVLYGIIIKFLCYSAERRVNKRLSTIE